ncbi:MAG: hypothetical protein ACAI44_13355 [Candidatus Sericytochromatia bacterium]
MSDLPATVPLRFFQSLNQKDYAQTWDCLTRYSQELMVGMLAGSWQEQTPEQLKAAFAKGQGPAKIYWDHFRATIQLETWLAQSYQSLGISGNEVLVTASPSQLTLLVCKEGQRWKFGYMETFLEKG